MFSKAEKMNEAILIIVYIMLVRIQKYKMAPHKQEYNICISLCTT